MVHLKLINTLWFPEGFSYATQEMFCSAAKMQLQLPRPASALRKAAVTQPLWKSRGERVPRPPSASSCWAGWGSSGLFPKKVSVAGSEAEILKVVRMLEQAYPSSTEMYLLFHGLAHSHGSPVAALQRTFASAGPLKSALPSPAGLPAEGLVGQYCTQVLLGIPLPPRLLVGLFRLVR